MVLESRRSGVCRQMHLVHGQRGDELTILGYLPTIILDV
jgi:hypothetical protein